MTTMTTSGLWTVAERRQDYEEVYGHFSLEPLAEADLMYAFQHAPDDIDPGDWLDQMNRIGGLPNGVGKAFMEYYERPPAETKARKPAGRSRRGKR